MIDDGDPSLQEPELTEEEKEAERQRELEVRRSSKVLVELAIALRVTKRHLSPAMYSSRPTLNTRASHWPGHPSSSLSNSPPCAAGDGTREAERSSISASTPAGGYSPNHLQLRKSRLLGWSLPQGERGVSYNDHRKLHRRLCRPY